MKHFHEKSGKTFECGELVEPDRTKTYDIIVITYWPDEDDIRQSLVELVGYYFGEYEPGLTNYYIDKYLEERNVERVI